MNNHLRLKVSSENRMIPTPSYQYSIHIFQQHTVKLILLCANNQLKIAIFFKKSIFRRKIEKINISLKFLKIIKK